MYNKGLGFALRLPVSLGYITVYKNNFLLGCQTLMFGFPLDYKADETASLQISRIESRLIFLYQKNS